ncbi:LysM peptidoglycan-binding domain-containing M23 family metallopeptidase [Streptomyces sp. NPDC097619]|uniref:LysM peptidoglycan-binding domain-containing M23 family metallopeptidase n=1 Tax=Streptomyces sp. NPDC097619 TaxID=3157228 RepID=UPI00331A5BC4
MPGKGKHRRPKSSPIGRGFVAAGTGGAALALPLLGAATAHAAPAQATAVAPKAVDRLPGQAASQAAPAAAKKAPQVYTVVSGDCLSAIAASEGVKGGWEQLYADNRAAVGSDPALIHPGLKLTLGGRSAAGAGEAAAPRAAAPAPERKSAERGVSSEDGTGGERAARSAERTATAPRESAPEQESAPEENTSGEQQGSGFTAPVDAQVTTQYRQGGSMWSSGYHTGVDFAVGSGTTVKAVGAGTVVSAGWAGAYGNEVIVRHADGRYSQYAHLSSLSVSSGQSVSAGTALGLSGSTGNSSGPHLHFEIRTGPSYGQDVDPLAYLRGHGVSI